MFKIEILVKGSHLKWWESVLEALLKLLTALDAEVEAGIVYEVTTDKQEEING